MNIYTKSQTYNTPPGPSPPLHLKNLAPFSRNDMFWDSGNTPSPFFYSYLSTCSLEQPERRSKTRGWPGQNGYI
jgi:hypothetical protein